MEMSRSIKENVKSYSLKWIKDRVNRSVCRRRMNPLSTITTDQTPVKDLAFPNLTAALLISNVAESANAAETTDTERSDNRITTELTRRSSSNRLDDKKLLVNAIRDEMGRMIDEKTVRDQSLHSSVTDPIREKSVEPNHRCSCNFIHYSLRQMMIEAEQIKQFARNMVRIGLDPLTWKETKFISSSSSSAVYIPMRESDELTQSCVIQCINTSRGEIKIKLDPHAFGLAPFFSDHYEKLIKDSTSHFQHSHRDGACQ